MTRATRLSSLVLVSIFVGCLRAPVPAAPNASASVEPPAPAPASEPAPPEGEPKRYSLLADAIGIRIGIEAGFLRDGQTLEFIVTNPDGGARLGDATMTIGTPPDALVLHSDDQGRIAFPVRLDLVEKNPEIRLVSPSTPHPEFELNLTGTLSFHCDKEHGLQASSTESITQEQLAQLRHEDFGPERVYAIAEGVTDAQVRAMGKHLVRLRAAYRKVTGWDPPPLHVLLTPKKVSVMAGAGATTVWTLAPEHITDHNRGTAFLAHEWTHAALGAHSSGAAEPSQRWIEDGLCELVAYHVEKQMFPRSPATRLSMRAKELEQPEAPESFELMDVATPKATSLYGALAAQCEGTKLFGYGFALAFWLAAVPDGTDLVGVIRELESEPLLGVARKHAAKAFAEFRVERACAKQIVAGKRSCARG